MIFKIKNRTVSIKDKNTDRNTDRNTFIEELVEKSGEIEDKKYIENIEDSTGTSDSEEKTLFKRFLKSRAGFTLIEMVIVVTIIGILAGVSFVKYQNVQEKARISADVTNAANIAAAAYIADNEGVISIKKGNVDIDDLRKKGYISSVPKSQSMKNQEFMCEYSDSIKDFKVSAGGTVFYPEYSKAEKPAEK